MRWARGIDTARACRCVESVAAIRAHLLSAPVIAVAINIVIASSIARQRHRPPALVTPPFRLVMAPPALLMHFTACSSARPFQPPCRSPYGSVTASSVQRALSPVNVISSLRLFVGVLITVILAASAAASPASSRHRHKLISSHTAASSASAISSGISVDIPFLVFMAFSFTVSKTINRRNTACH